MSDSLNYLGLSLRYPDKYGAFTELQTGPAKPSDIALPLGISPRFLNLAEGFMMHADGRRIIYTYFNIDNPDEPLVASIAADIALLIPGRPIVTLLAALRNHMIARSPINRNTLLDLASRSGFPTEPNMAPERTNPFNDGGAVAWRTYMSGTDLAAICAFPSQDSYAPYAALLILQPTVIASPEKSLPRVPDTLDRSLWVVCPEGVSVSNNPVDASEKLTITYSRPGFASVEQTIDVGQTNRYAYISVPALIVNTPEKAGIEFSRSVTYSVADENGEPLPTHTLLVNGRAVMRNADSFVLSSADFRDGKAEISVSATNFRPVKLSLSPEMINDGEPLRITLKTEKRGTLLRFDFGDGRIFENSVVFEKNDPEYLQLRAGVFHGFRANRIVGSDPETYNVVISADNAAAEPIDDTRSQPVAPVIENEAPSNQPEAPKPQTLNAPDIRPLEEPEEEPQEKLPDDTPTTRREGIRWGRVAAIAAALVVIAGIAIFFMLRPADSPASAQPGLTAVNDSIAAADTVGVIAEAPDATPTQPAQTSSAQTPAPAVDGMGADLAYFNKNNVWRRDDLTTDAGRAFFDTLVSGNIDAIASSDYFAIPGRATNKQAVKMINLLWASKGTGTQNSNQRVLTGRKKSGVINLNEVYDALARYRDANPNTSPRPAKTTDNTIP